MIKERYCSFEVAKLLKEKGFVIPCDWIYCSDGTFGHKNSLWDKEMFLAPTHQMACDWLREKGYHIEIYANASGYRFIISKTPPDGTDLVCDIEGNNDGGAWDDFGECIETALKYAFENLI